MRIEQSGSAQVLERRRSRAVAHDETENLLYIVTTDIIWIYSFPKTKYVASFNVSGAENPCANKDQVFVPQYGPDDIVEYAHGGTEPISTLKDPGENPESCAIDPTTGNLAVTNYGGASKPGDVVIYGNPQRPPTLYSDREIYYYWFCGYDNKGDLFVDGM
jgi:hypothetical protein